ncbi:class I SAM-dependent methyltransferase [bacterium]|nr:class I SAM-dependent methyltransferase [candidate division CSSED10-310 bacterium]
MLNNKRNGEPEFDMDVVFEPQDYLYFYQDAIGDDITIKQMEFMVQELELDQPMRILDLACGHGRHANHLAELGHMVTGVDISKGFLELATRQARQIGAEVRYIQQDMRAIDFSEEFDRALLLFTSFGYFDDNENELVLANIARALIPGGILLFDIPNRDALLATLDQVKIIERKKDLMINQLDYDATTGRLMNRRIVIRDGHRKDKPFSTRLYGLPEIKELLHRNGLVLHKLYGDWHGTPFDWRSKSMIVIAKKDEIPSPGEF